MTTQSAYDRAEFAAIAIARIATDETDGAGTTAAVWSIVQNTAALDGEVGITGLVVALGRQYASALAVIAHNQDLLVSDVLDGFEQHKLEQIAAEQDGES